MKTLMILAAITFPPQGQEMCKKFGDLAEIIMNARQIEVPISELLEISKRDADAVEAVLEAYKRPAYSTPEMRKQAARRFRNDMETKCLMSIATAN